MTTNVLTKRFWTKDRSHEPFRFACLSLLVASSVSHHHIFSYWWTIGGVVFSFAITAYVISKKPQLLTPLDLAYFAAIAVAIADRFFVWPAWLALAAGGVVFAISATLAFARPVSKPV